MLEDLGALTRAMHGMDPNSPTQPSRAAASQSQLPGPPSLKGSWLSFPASFPQGSGSQTGTSWDTWELVRNANSSHSLKPSHAAQQAVSFLSLPEQIATYLLT